MRPLRDHARSSERVGPVAFGDAPHIVRRGPAAAQGVQRGQATERIIPGQEET